MIGGLGWQELLIILVIIALIFGATRVADLGGALGRGIREFRQEAARPDDEEEEEDSGTASASGGGSSDDEPAEASDKESSG
ncbi:MAG: twin-arginine translocase TatA/TatE family subunit [Chloroflexi bacterium]|nr:twin-arginine translocase TatA/TatE family subunit [Chloroflexota bacterium]